MNIILSEYAEGREFTAGNKARTDTVNVLKKAGYKHIPLYRSGTNKGLVLIQMIFGLVRTIILSGKNDRVAVQYPYYPLVVNRALFSILNYGSRIREYKTILLIHDVVGLRKMELNESVIRGEIRVFNRFDVVVCHNESMKRKLHEYGARENMVTMQPFFYLYDGEKAEIPIGKKVEIVVAGNLSRNVSEYVLYLNELTDVKWNLYGIGYQGESTENVEYFGEYAPDELISQLRGNYGLIWNGDSLDTCTGDFGSYIRYNNPHKLSLYLAAGLPVIIWSEAALAGYVKEEKIGICIDSLKSLGKILGEISIEEYEEMCRNVMRAREEVIGGGGLLKAIEKRYG